MKQPITGFHKDDKHDWVAELACGHTQHVRHNPPWQLRPWVTSEKGRKRYIGHLLDCKECDMMNSSLHRRTCPDWFLDELANAGRENVDVDHTTRYDSKEDADAAGELSLLKDLGLNGQSEIVDLGAGTGQFALAAASICRRVIAVDISAAMLDVLQAKIETAGLSNVEIVRAGFLTYRHRSEPVDFVYSRYALHHLPDFWKAIALQRIRSIVRPGALLRLWDVVYHFNPDEAEDRLDRWCASISEDIEGNWRRSDIEEHIRDEHSTFTWLLEPMIEQNGFEIEEAEYSPDGIFAKYIARAI